MKTTLSILILIIISSCNRIQYCTKEIHEAYNNGYRAGSFHVLDSVKNTKWNTQAKNQLTPIYKQFKNKL